MAEQLIYLDDFSDEVMPCAPTLEAWAAWLAAPDPAWMRDVAAEDGATFRASTCDVLGDVRADLVEGEWRLASPPPEGTDEFFLRWHEGSTGWDADFSGNTVQDALDCYETDAGPVWLACVGNGPDVVVRYEAEGPRCVIVGPVQ